MFDFNHLFPSLDLGTVAALVWAQWLPWFAAQDNGNMSIAPCIRILSTF